MGMFFPGGRVPQPSYYLTAYDVAKRHGYRGSEADFAAALIRAASDKTEFWCITPEMYGAYGDGVTDDTDAIRTAIEAAIEQDVPLVCNGTYIITRTQPIDCRGNLTMIGTGTFKRKDDFITATNNKARMIFINSYSGTHILVDGLTFDGNRAGQHLDTDWTQWPDETPGYHYEHCHSFCVTPYEDGGTVVYRNLRSVGRIGDGFNVSSNNKYPPADPENPTDEEKAAYRSYIFDNVVCENITGDEGTWKRADVCVTAPCKYLTFRGCNVGHLETELNLPEYRGNVIFCSDCHVSNWLELGSADVYSQKIYMNGVSLDSGVLELYGEINASNCDLNTTCTNPDIYMYGGVISDCRITTEKKINIVHNADDPAQPDFNLTGCVLSFKGTDSSMFGGSLQNNDIRITIKDCLFDGVPDNEDEETVRRTMLTHRDGTIKIINNVIYGRAIDHNAKTMTTGGTLHITGNTFHNKGVPAYSIGLPGTSETWEIDFVSCGNKILGLADYVSVANVSRIRSYMHFYDTVYCSANPAQPMNGATYIQPAGVIKVATTNAASGLKIVSLA